MSAWKTWELTCDVRRAAGEPWSVERVVFSAARCVGDPRTHELWIGADPGDVDMTWDVPGTLEPAEWRQSAPKPSHADWAALPPGAVVGYEVRALDHLVCLVVRLARIDGTYLLRLQDSPVWLGGDDKWVAVARDPWGIGRGPTIREATGDALAQVESGLEADRREEERLRKEDEAAREREAEMASRAEEEARLIREREAAVAADQIGFPF